MVLHYLLKLRRIGAVRGREVVTLKPNDEVEERLDTSLRGG